MIDFRFHIDLWNGIHYCLHCLASEKEVDCLLSREPAHTTNVHCQVYYSFHCEVLSFIYPLKFIHPFLCIYFHHPSIDPSIDPSYDPSILIKTLVLLWVEFIWLIPPSLLFRSLPALVWHRQNWDIAFPVMEIEDSEVDVLKETSSYVAGVTDASVEGR